MAEEYLENLEGFKNLLQLSAVLLRRAQVAVAHNAVADVRVTTWLFSRRQRVLLTAATLLILSSVVKLFFFIAGPGLIRRDVLDFSLSRGAIYILEAALLILIVVYVVQKGERDETSVSNAALQRAFRAENRFFVYWPYLWFTWFILYALLTYNELHPAQSPYFYVVANFANNLSGMFIFALFYELTERTTDNTARSRKMWLPLLMLLILLATGEALLYGNATDSNVTYLFGLFSGILVGIFTGLLVSRLTSRIFAFPVSALAVLTLFAIIQPVFPVLTVPALPYHAQVGYFIAFGALYAKMVLLIAIEWMRDRYTIVYYMVNVAKLFDDERDRHVTTSFQQLMERLLHGRESPHVAEPDKRAHIRPVATGPDDGPQNDVRGT